VLALLPSNPLNVKKMLIVKMEKYVLKMFVCVLVLKNYVRINVSIFSKMIKIVAVVVENVKMEKVAFLVNVYVLLIISIVTVNASMLQVIKNTVGNVILLALKIQNYVQKVFAFQTVQNSFLRHVMVLVSI